MDYTRRGERDSLVPAARFLLEHGPDPQRPGEKGQTPIDHARRHGFAPILRLLEVHR